MDYHTICQHKHDERLRSLLALPQANSYQHLSPQEHHIHSLSISDLVQECSAGRVSKQQVADVYSKKLLQAQSRSNCVSDVLITDDSLWSLSSDSPSAPLLGVPVSVKDSIDVAGHSSTIGFARYASKPAQTHSPLTRLMLDAGCILLAKSTVPTALFSVSTSSPLWSGPTLNPHNPLYGVGASTGGGAALIASRASLVEIGSDVAGSLRFPAHFNGCYTLKASVGRWPSSGNRSSMEGVNSIETLGGPLTCRMGDLTTVWRAVVGMKPWDYDERCVPLAWREEELKDVQKRKLRWGIIWSDGVIPPSPACRRAVAMCVDALRESGHDVIDLTPHTPSIPTLLDVGYKLAFGDGGQQITSHLMPGEDVNPALRGIIDLVQMPRWLRWIIGRCVSVLDSLCLVPNPVREATSTGEHKKSFWSRFRSISSYWAPHLSLLYTLHSQTVASTRELVQSRDEFRRKWHQDIWDKYGVDFLITPVAPFPAVREGGERRHPLSEGGKGEGKVGKGEDAEQMGLVSAGYAFLFNLLDYTAGAMPVTTVDRDLDILIPAYSSSSSVPPSVIPEGQVYQRKLPESIYKRYRSKTHGTPSSLTPLADEIVEGQYHSDWERSKPYSSGLKQHVCGNGHLNGNGNSTGNGYLNGHGNGHANGSKETVQHPNGNGHLNGNGHHQSNGQAIRGSSFPAYYSLNPFSHTAYSVYDSHGMHGLPVGVQIVGRRLEEEKVLGGMTVLEDALKGVGWRYKY